MIISLKGYLHSILLEESICRGCTHCVRRCPTEAIRVMEGKARILPIRCVDCGECVRACPYQAHGVLFDVLSSVADKSNTFVLIPPVFFSHFYPPPSSEVMDKFFKSLGFKGSFDLSYIFEVYPEMILKYISNNNLNMMRFIPLLCPSIPRFLSVRFSELLQYIIKLESPWEIGARVVKDLFPEVKITLLASCPAQVTSIKAPLGVESSQIDYVIPINHVYSLAKRFLDKKYEENLSKGQLGANGNVLFEFLPNHQGLNVHSIDKVTDLLNEIEVRHYSTAEYFELWACSGGCAGGVLNAISPNIINFNLRCIKGRLKETIPQNLKEVFFNNFYSGKFNLTKEITPRPVFRLDDDIDVSMRKMEEVEHILHTLPGIDCGACGAPTCRAFAEDVVLGWSYITDCIFVLRDKLKKLAEEVRDLSHLGPPLGRYKNKEVK